MFLKLGPLLLGIFFFVCLEIIVINQELAIFVAVLLMVVSLFWAKNIGHKWKYSVLPVFFVFSSVCQLYLVGLHYEQQIFIILSSFMYYLAIFGAYRLGKYEGDKTARAMNMSASTATIFFTYSSLYGFYLNFLVPLYLLMIAYMLTTLLISYQHLSIICAPPGSEDLPGWKMLSAKSQKKAWLYSFLLALIMTELIWTMNFWPFGYLTTGAVALILYYILWDIVQSFFLNLLSRKRMMANTVLFSLLVALILISSKWIPVI